MEKYSKKEFKRRKEKLSSASKFIALVLRHKAIDFGIDIDTSGFIKVSDLINLPQGKKYNFSVDMIKEIVANDEKGRYQIEDRPPLYIRAVQGHSMAKITNDEALTKIDNILKYPTVVHGTNDTAWGFIEKTGLNKMQRNAVHFSIGYANDNNVKSGMRKTCTIFIELNAIEAFYNHIEFYISLNKVILSPGIEGVIPPKYFKKVTNKNLGIVYAEKYVYIIYIDNEAKKIIVYKDGNEIITDDKAIITAPLSLNSFSKKFIEKEFVKEAFIVVINKSFQTDYITYIKDYYSQLKLEYPAIFTDYICYDKVKQFKEFSKDLTAKLMEKINLDSIK